MPLLRRASEQTQSEWRAVPDGLWRWQVSVPELQLSERYGKYRVRFPLWLTEPERERLMAEHPLSPSEHNEGVQQSWRSTYTVGLSLGFMKDGQYQSTKMVDFLAACLGQGNGKRFREWIGQGGGPPRPDDLDDQQAEIEAITEWLKWWENLEVYGTITQRPGEGGIIYANFAGPMPIGSLPGQKDPDYEALGRGKLRAIIAESGDTREQHALEHRAGPQVVFEDDEPHCPVCKGVVDIRYTANGDKVARCSACKMNLAIAAEQPAQQSMPPAGRSTSDVRRLSPEELDKLPF